MSETDWRRRFTRKGSGNAAEGGGRRRRANEKWKVSNESRNNLCSLLVSFLLLPTFILSPSFAPYGRAAYVFRCTAGCTTPNGVSNIFLSVDSPLFLVSLALSSFAPLADPIPPRRVDRLPNSFRLNVPLSSISLAPFQHLLLLFLFLFLSSRGGNLVC